MKTQMASILFALSAMGPAQPVRAEELAINPIVDARLRYESVDQAGIEEDANAITIRIRAGAEAVAGDFSLLVEGEGTLAILEDYNSGLNGKSQFPVVADPQTLELNRLQLRYTGLPETTLTLGRQRINLDDQRFIGTVLWRQNEQTYDAIRAEWTSKVGFKADLTYSWAVNTIWGVDGFGARQQQTRGDNVFANLSYKAKNWGLTGFAYLVDQDEIEVQNFQNSSQTFGLRGQGTIPLGPSKLKLAASYARQQDYGRNPNQSKSEYVFGEAVLETNKLSFTAGYELLGADGGTPLSSFQTPLATLHKFNGFADKFLINPPNGLKDLYLGVGYASNDWRALPGFNINLTWHRFGSDRLAQRYGTEWNLVGGFSVSKTTSLLVKYANYDQSGVPNFAGDQDTEKLWIQLDYKL